MKFLQNCLYIFRFNYPRSPEGGILFYLCPSFRPSKIFFSATIDDTNLIFGHKFHIVGSIFGPIRFLLPVCRLGWFYTHWTYMRGYHKWALAHSSSCYVKLFEYKYLETIHLFILGEYLVNNQENINNYNCLFLLF